MKVPFVAHRGEAAVTKRWLTVTMFVLLTTTISCASIWPIWPFNGSRSQPLRIEWQFPIDGSSDQLVAVSSVWIDPSTEWYVFYYQVNDQIHTIYARREHCTRDLTLAPNSFIVHNQARDRTALEDIRISYNPGQLERKTGP